MYKITKTYKDYDGEERTESFYFNLSRAEVLDMQLEDESSDLSAKIQAIIDAKDKVSVIKYFKDILKASYGVKSEDGKHFIKNDKVWEDFVSSPAYEEIYLDLLFSDKASEFINNVLPSVADMDAVANRISAANTKSVS